MKVFFRVLFFISFLSNAQYKIIQYNTLNSNLPHDLCYGLEQDNKGFIWLGTDEGLVRFNGQDFKNYTIKEGLFSNYVIDITKYSKDTLALVTWGGGIQFLTNNKFVNFGEKLKLSKIKRFNFGVFTKGVDYVYYTKNVFEKKDFIYLDSTKIGIINNGDKKNLKNCYPNFEVIDNKLYFFNDFNQNNLFTGVYTLNKDKLVKDFIFLNDYPISSLGKINENYFFATSHDRIIFFNSKEILRIQQIPFKKYIIKNTFYRNDILVFTLHDLMTKKERVLIYEFEKKKFEFIESNLIGKQLISDILIDKDNIIWISTFGAGLFKVFKEEIYITNKKITSENVLDINEDKENVYFLSAYKLFIINKITNQTDSIVIDTELWKFGLNDDNEIRIHIRNNNNVEEERKLDNHIVISNQKPNRIKKNHITIEFIESDILIKNNLKSYKYRLKNKIRKVIIHGQLVYIATTNGLLIYDTENYNFKTLLSRNKEKANNDIKDMVFQGDKLWIASTEGLIAFYENKLTNYSNHNELLGASINSLFLDNHNIIWLATQKGFVVFKNNEFYNFFYKDEDVSTFTKKVYEDQLNNMWVIGNKGVLKINNEKEFKPRENPIINVTQSKLVFTVDAISFSKIDILKEFKVNNQGWQQLTEPSVNFKNFQYGNYKIQFRARLLNSNWTYSKRYSFSIKAPWYKQFWSLLLIVFLSGTIVIIMIYIRLKHVQRRNAFLQRTILQNEDLQKELNKVRENVAQDFHDELGNKLAGITVLSGMIIEDDAFKKTNWFMQLDRINKDAKELYFGIKDFIWSIDSKNDDLNELIFYLKDFGEELFMSTKIKFHLEVKHDRDKVKLPYYWSRQLLLLFKEAMTNTLKYSEATHCVLKVKAKKNLIKITFSDNGKGFNPTTLKRKNGLLNMGNRAKKIDGKLEINSINGTQIIFISKSLF